jgi:hypothetical protein
MDDRRTFAAFDLARHDPSFVVVEVRECPGTLQIGSIETGSQLVKIIGYTSPGLVARIAARLKLSELPIRARPDEQ